MVKPRNRLISKKNGWLPRDCEEEKEEASSLMAKVAPLYSVNSRSLKALLSSMMNPLLNINTSWQCTSTNSNTFYKVLYLVLGLLYIIVHKKL